MFINLKYQETIEFLAIDAIALVEKTHEDDFPYQVLLKTGHIKKLSKHLYDQIYDALTEKETV
jgi:hypothetical protein